MPPKNRFTREEIIQAALDIARVGGISAVTARAVGSRLNATSRVIFSQFRSMEELQTETLAAAHALYQQRLQQDMAEGRYPPYKASGMSYIRFAREERELFRLLFMRDRSRETIPQTTEETEPLIAIIRRNTGLSDANARLLHLEMWLFVHGIAAMSATSYAQWDTDFVSEMLTHAYQGMVHSLRERGEK